MLVACALLLGIEEASDHLRRTIGKLYMRYRRAGTSRRDCDCHGLQVGQAPTGEAIAVAIESSHADSQ